MGALSRYMRSCVGFGILVLLCCSIATSAFGQVPAADSAFVDASVEAALQSYRQAIGVQAHLYTGQEYVDYRKYNREGHQFFQIDEFTPGTVLYEGAIFEGIPMAYDLVRDELIIRNRANTVMQQLIPEKVAFFLLQGHVFVRYNQDSAAVTTLPAGYYDLLFRDKVMLLSKRRKEVVEKPQDFKVVQIFSYSEQYYVFHNRQYHQVRNKRGIYKVFKDRKKELQKFAREKNLNFKDREEAAFTALVEHYNSLQP